MAKRTIYLFSFCIAFFISCKKTPLPEDSSSEEPVFYVKCNINGVPLNLSAGTNDYYMNSSHYLDTNNVYVYKAELMQNSCSNNCGYSLTILINDDKVSSAGALPDVNNTFRSGEYGFFGSEQAPLFYRAKFTPVTSISEGINYTWEFDTMKVNTYEAEAILSSNKKHIVNLLSDGKCVTKHCNVFDVGNPLQTSISVFRLQTTDGTLKYKFEPSATGQAPYRYYWTFGDKTAPSTEALPEHAYTQQGYYTAVLRLIDANNDTCFSYYQVPAFYETTCNANFTAVFTPIPNPKVLSAVTVIITDPNGKTYSSKYLMQPNVSKFEIMDVSEYKTNKNGEQTKKIKFNFNCVVNDGENKITISGGEAVMALSY